jgi:hypothetical protein
MLVRKNHGALSNSLGGIKMKNNLRMLGLGLCMLPMCLHAGTGENNRQTYQAAELIPAGTLLPVTLNSALRSDKSGSGTKITATVMQDVPLGAGKTLRSGSKLMGHVIETITSGKGSDESTLSFRFDELRFENRTVPITANLKALASFVEVHAAQIPTSGGDGISESGWSLLKIGDDQIHIGSAMGSECGGAKNSNNTAQEFWLFSPNACGTYGLGDLQISRSGRTAPLGEVTLTSNGKVVKVDKGSAMLLRVSGGESEEAPDRMTTSRGVAQ